MENKCSNGANMLSKENCSSDDWFVWTRHAAYSIVRKIDSSAFNARVLRFSQQVLLIKRSMIGEAIMSKIPDSGFVSESKPLHESENVPLDH
jgi:hypothetical protein